jgi:hypothetical protein
MRYLIIAILLLFSCGKKTVTEYEEVRVPIIKEFYISTQNVYFWVEESTIFMATNVVNFDAIGVEYQEPAMVIFNLDGYYEVGFGHYYIDGEELLSIPPLSLVVGYVELPGDSLLATQQQLWGMNMLYWKNREDEAKAMAGNYINYLLKIGAHKNFAKRIK